ncbi:MAG: hypothetical protein ACKV22_31625 [Bryobacteraceae bacterium]
MFFRRERPKIFTFEERLQSLKQNGFQVEPLTGGRAQLTRQGYGAIVENASGEVKITVRPGVLVGGEIATLVDGGFQKYFMTPSGRKVPALAEQLKAVHAFQEDLRESAGLTSLYNESLGTTSTRYLYDRVKDRDRGVPRRPWE